MRLRNETSERSSQGGWMLSETMVAVAIGISFLVAMVGVFMSTSISFVEIGNYMYMDQLSRNALDKMSKNIRNAYSLTSYDSAKLVFNFDSAGSTNLTYRYDASSGLLTEEWLVSGSTTSSTLLSGCSNLAFTLYTRDLATTTDVSTGEGKVIGVSWQCMGTALGRTNTEYMQQAQIVIRNQP